MFRVEAEGDRHQRQHCEQVALLEARRAVRGVERRLGHEPGGEDGGERGECGLRPSARTHERDERAGHEHDPGREREQEEVEPGPAQELAADVQVRDVRVVAEHAGRPQAEGDDERERQQHERQALRLQRALPVDDERGDDEGGGEDDVLNAREGREEREREEEQLRPLRRSVECCDACDERAHREWVRDRIGERVRREDEIGDRDREDGAAQRVPGRERQAARE